MHFGVMENFMNITSFSLDTPFHITEYMNSIAYIVAGFLVVIALLMCLLSILICVTFLFDLVAISHMHMMRERRVLVYL